MSLDRVGNYPGNMLAPEAWYSSNPLPARNTEPGAALEAALPPNPEVEAVLDKMARDYACEVLGGVDTQPSGQSFANAYLTGMHCIKHVDQYDRPPAPHTMNRTVSLSFCLERAEVGGLMGLQDHDMKEPTLYHPLNKGQVIMFPGDWWHHVQYVERGVRRCIIRWYADPALEKFNSPKGDG